ncbi:MAG: LPS export ABC transporter permease LptF [Nitrospirae bacterium]|nr:MAG: LPS export ABC transporter permease LptF [Nitrospirota bacterium]
MVKLLDRYVVTEVIPPFLLGMGVFTFLFLMNQLVRLADLILVQGVGAWQVFKVLVYTLPSLAVFTIPMSVLLGVVVAFGRMSADSEVTALRAAGVSLQRLLVPVNAFAFVAFLLTGYTTAYLVPQGNQALKRLLYEIVREGIGGGIKQHIFNDDFPGLTIYINSTDVTGSTLQGIVIHDERRPERLQTITARRGTLRQEPGTFRLLLHLEDGTLQQTAAGSDRFRLVKFADYDLALDLPAVDPHSHRFRKQIKDYSMQELRQALRESRQDPERHLAILVELNRRRALPVTCFLFATVGLPLGIRSRRSGKSAGFATAIGVVLVYYLLMAAAENLARGGALPVVVAVWIPNLLFAAGAAWLVARTAYEVPTRTSRVWERLLRLTRRLTTLPGWGR